jgi:amino acid adenylation domain-containing protein
VLHALGDEAPHRPVDRLPVQPPAERTRAIAVFGRGPVIVGEEVCLHELIERQVDATPERVALVGGETEVSYRELDERANRLAHRLIAAGVAVETPVGICLPRSLELVVAVLAVLKAGGAYVPLDPDYPPARLDFMLADAGARVLIARADRTDRCDAAVAVIDVAAADSGPTTRPRVRVLPDNLAYVIYTSGSTGTPKGVMNAHRGVVNRIRWGQRRFALHPDEAVLFKTPFSFDVAGEELYWPLTTGARLVVARPGGHREADYLADLIRSRGVTTVHFVPSMLNTFLAQDGAAGCAAVLRRLVCSGEALAPALADRVHEVLPGVRLFNFYGPTEAAIEVVAGECHPGEPRVTIGQPIDNTRAYILDAHGEPVPVGVAGELHIGGLQVARGYWHRPGLTARAFVPDPFGYGTRLYRSGDQVRLLDGGSIDYLGRLDQQVKIRGVRIELAEVEAALATHPAVRAAAVHARPGPGGTPRLVGYLVGAGSPPDAAELRSYLAARLPTAMLPAAYVVVPALPLSPSGKLDRGALPEPEAAAAPEYAAPRTAVEEILAQIWAEVLGLDRVSIRDDFFELGGHSLLATQVLARVRAELGVEPPVAELLSGRSTVEGLAEVIAERQLAGADPDDLLALIAELDDA